MRDMRLVFGTLAGLVALAAGVLAPVLHMPTLGLLAGVAAVTAVAVAALLAMRLHEAEASLAHERAEAASRPPVDLDSMPGHELLSADDDLNPDDSAIDPISGLLSQRYFSPTLERRVALARRQLRPLSLLLIMVDGFEAASNEACDHAMSVVGSVLRQTLRDSDTICRVGPAEAALMLEDTPEAGAVWCAERIRNAMHSTPGGDTITLSVGVASYPSHALNARELLLRAKRALSWAQSQGRDRGEVARVE